VQVATMMDRVANGYHARPGPALPLPLPLLSMMMRMEELSRRSPGAKHTDHYIERISGSVDIAPAQAKRMRQLAESRWSGTDGTLKIATLTLGLQDHFSTLTRLFQRITTGWHQCKFQRIGNHQNTYSSVPTEIQKSLPRGHVAAESVADQQHATGTTAQTVYTHQCISQ
jgi:hypothetical protein